jgi:hypothetical protein
MGCGGVYHHDIDPYCSSEAAAPSIWTLAFFTRLNTHVQYLQQLIHYTYVAVDQIPAPWTAASIFYFSIKTSSSNLLLHLESRLDKPTYFPRDFCLGIAELYIIYGWLDWQSSCFTYLPNTARNLESNTHRQYTQRWYLNPEQKTLHTSPETHQIILKYSCTSFDQVRLKGGRAGAWQSSDSFT